MRPSPRARIAGMIAVGEIVPAEDIGLELGAEHVAPDILERARLAVAAIVEQRVEPAVRCLKHLIGSLSDRVRLRIVEIDGSRPASTFSRAISSGFRAVANTRQPRAFICAAQSPMPDEQPVMRMDLPLMPMLHRALPHPEEARRARWRASSA